MKGNAYHIVNAQNMIPNLGTHKGPWMSEMTKSSLSTSKLKFRLTKFLPNPEHAFCQHFFMNLCDKMTDSTGKLERNKMLSRGCLCRKPRPGKGCLEMLIVLFTQ